MKFTVSWVLVSARFSAAHAADPKKDQSMADAYAAAIAAACERRPLKYKEAPYPENCSSR